MPEWTASPDRVCGFGEDGTVTLAVEDWQLGGDAPALSASAGAVVTGSVEAIGLPSGETADDPGPIEVSDDAEPRALATGRLDAGVTRLVVDATPQVHLAFEGPAVVERADDLWIRFPDRTPLTVGFREELPPRPTVSVHPTPRGIAAAVTTAARTHRTGGPERSHPGFRPRTPAVTFAEGPHPDDGRCDPSNPGVDDGSPAATVTVPDSTEAVLVAAPLAYYLGAGLRVDSGVPRLRGPGVSHAFGSLPEFADQVADALRSLVHLDGRLRSVPGETGRGSVDPDRAALADATPAERLASVLESPPASLPTWPLTTYVNDDPGNGRFLPYLLDRLSLVVPARSSALDPQGLLKRSLDEFYRGESPNVQAVDPSLADSRYHAWLGDGTPVDAFTLLGARSTGTPSGVAPRRSGTQPGGSSSRSSSSGGSSSRPSSPVDSSPEGSSPVDSSPEGSSPVGSSPPERSATSAQSASTERRGRPDRSEPSARSQSASGAGEGIRIDIVCNEPEMAAERDVASVYRERIDVGDVDVVVHERLSTAELAAVLQRPTAHVHFIGHCEVDGIRCPDGTLAAADLETCRARSFFLNACGSYYEGYDLVRRGATVGAVTLTAVLDEQAVTLGTAFAELLAAGFAFDRALSIARGEIIVGRDYAVVGDGTHRLRPARTTSAMCHLEAAGDAFELRYDPLAPDSAGRGYPDPFDARNRPCGRAATATLEQGELLSFLERFSLPVRFDGAIRWSDELACSLPGHERQN